MAKTALIIGGGMTGCTMSYLLLKKGWKVILFEKESFLGGGCRTLYYGGHPYTFGPRHLITPYPEAYEFMDKLVPLRRLNHYLLTYIEQERQFFSYPVHKDDVPLMKNSDKINKELNSLGDVSKSKNFEEFWTNSLGKSLYDMFVNNYSKKMWDIPSNTLIDDFGFSPKGKTLQTGTHEVVSDWMVGYPYDLDGYNKYFDICTKGADVILDAEITKYDIDNYSLWINDTKYKGDIIISSISLDILMNYQYGELPFMGRDFIKIILPIEQIISDPTYFLHYPGQEEYLRIVEYKKLTGYKAPDTLIGLEIPSHKNKLYPLPFKSEQARAQKYLDALPDNIFSLGRMGKYRYIDVDDIIMDSLKLIKQL